jgi:hypothetical protein
MAVTVSFRRLVRSDSLQVRDWIQVKVDDYFTSFAFGVGQISGLVRSGLRFSFWPLAECLQPCF